MHVLQRNTNCTQAALKQSRRLHTCIHCKHVAKARCASAIRPHMTHTTRTQKTALYGHDEPHTSMPCMSPHGRRMYLAHTNITRFRNCGCAYRNACKSANGVCVSGNAFRDAVCVLRVVRSPQGDMCHCCAQDGHISGQRCRERMCFAIAGYGAQSTAETSSHLYTGLQRFAGGFRVHFT